jgi:GST-like protein
MLDLYFAPTPNGHKITILLEELALPYNMKLLNLSQGDQFAPDYLRIAPNNRMPALVDHEPIGGGKPISIFESGAIMMYVAEKAGRFFPQEVRKRFEVVQWVMWQMGNQGPKMGEQGHFRRASADPKNGDLKYPVTRFDNEVHRLFGVMNLGLFEKNWLAAGEYTIADMICYPWASRWKDRGIDLEEFPNTKRWLTAMAARPAVKKGSEIGAEYSKPLDSMTLEERDRVMRVMTNQRAVPIPKEWTRKGG